MVVMAYEEKNNVEEENFARDSKDSLVHDWNTRRNYYLNGNPTNAGSKIVTVISGIQNHLTLITRFFNIMSKK